jgi:ribonuclease Z
LIGLFKIVPRHPLGKVSDTQVISLLFSELTTVYDGPIVQTQYLTVFNVTKEAVVARQAKQFDQLPPTPGVQRVAFKPVPVPPPAWWAEALIPLDDVTI